MWYAEAIDATAVYVFDTTSVDIMEDVAEFIICVEGATEQAHKCLSLGKKRGGAPYQTFQHVRTVQYVIIIFRLPELYQLFLGCCFTSWRGGSGCFQNSQCLTPNPPPLQPFFSCIGLHLAIPTLSIYHIDPLRDTVEKELACYKWVCEQSEPWPSNPSSVRRNKVFVKTEEV